ncbi:Tat pathway signal protein [Caenispirillum salinarum]|uniref:Tat pathway signal protein n=1 Tax=Caenispirillum salinarum TaxID=859058 RepID=UPI00385000DE
MRCKHLLTPIALCGALGAWLPAHAEEPARPVTVELNKLETAGGDCRVTWVLSNASPHDYDRLKLDIVAFDADGVVAKRLGAEMGPLPAEATRVKLFDLTGLDCRGISRLLLNGVLTCETGATAGPDACAMVPETASRASIPFIQ